MRIAHIVALALILSACSSCAVLRPAGQSAAEQYNAMVLIRTTCTDGQVTQGSGILVSDNRVLTAQHVVKCAIAPGLPFYWEPASIEVLASTTRKVLAEVELEISAKDVARLKLKDNSLADFFSTVRVGPPPQVGDEVCEVSAVPRPTYRCGRAQEASPGYVALGMMVENGNSGSAVFDSKGRLVGIVTNLVRCQDGVICAGYGTSVTGYAWLVPAE